MKPHGRLALGTVLLALAVLAAALPAQTPTPVSTAGVGPGAGASWPTSNGDDSGRGYSTLRQIDASNVGTLIQAWVAHPSAGAQGSSSIKAAPVEIDGVLYFSAPDNVWAADARTGRELWHVSWPPKGGYFLGNRGVAVRGSTVYFETTDCNLLALDASSGAERWHQSICDLDDYYYSSAAPFLVKNHVIVGVSGDDIDIPGFISAYDPSTGALQWRWYAYPKPGTPQAKTWPNLDAMLHGGGMTWGYKTYDPELNLLYFGTGNAQPVIAGAARPGANLYTACLIALNPDNGELAWYFQPDPHEDHDWDAIEVPVLFDGIIDGKPRKLLANASRNGWFFVLDRTNGKTIVSKPFVDANWAEGGDDVDARGQPIPNPEKNPSVSGTLDNPDQGGAANWFPPAFNPETGLFYIDAMNAWSIYYVYDQNPKPEGWGGDDQGGYTEAELEAIDYHTGEPKWVHPWASPTRSGLLTTAGGLVFSAGVSRDVEALDAATGAPLWHGVMDQGVSNTPITYELDGKQYLVVAAGRALYAFTLPSH